MVVRMTTLQTACYDDRDDAVRDAMLSYLRDSCKWLADEIRETVELQTSDGVVISTHESSVSK